MSRALLDLRCQVPLHVVELNQLLGEVQTGKATIEMPSSCSGIVRRFPAQPGELVRVGDPLVTFEVEGEGEGEGGPGVVGRIPREEAPTRRVRLRPPRQTQ